MQGQGTYLTLAVTVSDNLELVDTESPRQRDAVTPQLKTVQCLLCIYMKSIPSGSESPGEVSPSPAFFHLYIPLLR